MFEQLLDHANVLGAGEGTKWRGGQNTGQEAVVVFVERKLPADEMDDDDLVPSVDPETGLPTDVWEVDRQRPMSLRSRLRPAPPGASVGPAGWSGTLGAYLRVDDRWLILSNNHVLVRHQQVAAGDPIYQPGGADARASSANLFARLHRYVPIRFGGEPNLVDAATAEMVDSTHVQRWAAEHGRLEPRLVGPLIGWVIRKVGRTSGFSQGRVLARNAIVDVDFGDEGVARFTGQIVTDPLLESGDSGSLGVTPGGNPFALGFAGSSVISLWNPIATVLRQLEIPSEALIARAPRAGIQGL